ncbi:RHS repeat-associated core domain-containing protein, partial [Ideonella azotifigens]
WDQAEAFGNSAPNENPSALGAFTLNLRFPGQTFDKETGLFYNLNRDYRATSGRYVESDPIGLAGGINTYAYVENDPINEVDALGLFATNPYKETNENTIVCNGLGEPVIRLAPQTELAQRCGISQCTAVHEESHISDALRQNRGICRGVRRNVLIVASNNNERKETERKAYKTKIFCLEQKLKEASCSSDCVKAIKEEILWEKEQLKNLDWFQ